MTRRFRTFLALSPLAVVLGAAACRGDLASYLRGPEQSSWSRQEETTSGELRVTTLQLQSQVWRGIPWRHTVQLFRPREVRYPKTALLMIGGGGGPSPQTGALAGSLAARVQAPFAVLYHLPNQPLFDGKSEDDLIAHTFDEYLKSGDETWPLLLPMVKSAVRAMDAVQGTTREGGDPAVEDFVVIGASKRGWTTYLTGASDRRVRAIAPMVFDNLNFRAQLPRQIELWGRYSEQIEDYTRRGLQQQLDTERGRRLTAMVDPWAYRDRLKMPKLLIHGANDRYWSTDATRIYWDDLPGDRHLLTVPNVGHNLAEDLPRVTSTLVAFFHAVAGGRPFPELRGRCKEEDGRVSLRVRSTLPPKEVRLWTARAPDLDFRPQRWEATPMAPDGPPFVGEVTLPASGGLALFAEAVYEIDGRGFTLSTPPRVFGRRPE